MKTIARVVWPCTVLALAAPAHAHHSAAAYDTQKEAKVSGTVVQYRFANPHVYLTLQVKKDDGSSATVEVEAGAAAVLNGLGFTKESVKSGDVVTIVGNPARRKPDAFVLGRELYKRDGRAAAAGADERTKNALKNCIPVGAPALMFYPVATVITVQRTASS